MSRFGMAWIRKSTVYETDRQPSYGITRSSLASLALFHITLTPCQVRIRGHPSIICGAFLRMIAQMVWEVAV